MALQQNSAEGMASGTALAAQQSGSGTAFNEVTTSGGATGIYSSTRASHGSQSYRFTSPASGRVNANFNGSPAASFAFRTYIYFETLPSGITALASFFNTSGATMASLAYVSGKLVVQDATATLSTFPTSLMAGRWYRFELQGTIGTSTTNGRLSAAYYALDSTTPVDPVFTTTTANMTTTNGFIMSIGKLTAAPTADFYLDNIAFDLGTSTPLGAYSPPANVAPVANAGPNQTNIEPWSVVTLAGTGSDSDGTVVTYSWTQTAGTTVALSSTSVRNPTFTAPPSLTNQTLTFRLTVTDNQGAVSTPDSVDITVLYATERAVIGGQEVPIKLEAVQA